MADVGEDYRTAHHPLAPWLSRLLVILFLAAGCDDATGPEETVVYFPLTVGSEWAYAPPRAEFGDPFPARAQPKC
jgi:hypothetical protein